MHHHPPPALSIFSIIRQFIIPVIIYQSPSQAAIRPPSCHLVYTYRAPASTSAARDAALLPRRLVKRQEPIVQGLESLDRQTAPPHTKSRPSSSGQRQTSKTKPSRLHRCIGSTAIIARPSCARLTRQLISARHFPLPVLARSARDVIGARHGSGFHQLSIARLVIAWPDAPLSHQQREPTTANCPRIASEGARSPVTTTRQEPRRQQRPRRLLLFLLHPSPTTHLQPDSCRHVEQSSQGGHR